jgi:Tfp pilus assembly ATPase PilU
MASSGDYYRMQTFNHALAKLVGSKTITEEEALGASTNPGDLKLLLKGVLSSGTSVQRQTEARPAMKINKGY